MRLKKVSFCNSCILSHLDFTLFYKVTKDRLNSSDYTNDEKFFKWLNEDSNRSIRVNQFISSIWKTCGNDNIFMRGIDCIFDVQWVDDCFYFVTSKGYALKDGGKLNSKKEFDEDSLSAKLLSVDENTTFTITGVFNKNFQPVNPDNDESRKIIFECFKSYHLKEYNGIQISHYEDCFNNRKRYCIIQYFNKR